MQHHQIREEDRVMSLNFAAGIDFPSQLPTATAPYFLLGLSSTGARVIRETNGRRAGHFSTPTSCYPGCARGESRRQFHHCSLPRRT